MTVIDQLRSIVGERWVLEGERLADYRHDGTFIEGQPLAAVLPADTEQTRRAVEACVAAEVAMFPRGRGTSLVGGPVATSPGIVISLERLDAIEIDQAAGVAIVGAGAITADIQAAAAAVGLMYPPDPASAAMCSIGGNVACNAGGMGCLKYGVTADYVLGMTVVLVDGRVLRLGGRTRKRSSGYRLAQLFVGSEGTLGLVTEVVLKLLPLTRHRCLAMVSFDSVEGAGAGVIRILAAGHLPSALEFMDLEALELVDSYAPSGLGRLPAALLLIEQDGADQKSVLEQVLEMVELLDGSDSRIAQSKAEGDRLWAVRRNYGKALLAIPNNFFAEDVAVPVGAVPEMLERIATISSETGLRIATAGHAGDGNLHPSLVFSDEQRHLVGPAAARIFEEAVTLGGTISAEHGLGALKRDHAILEHSADEIAIWEQLKGLFDPQGRLNPGKVLPVQQADGYFLDRQPGWLAGRRMEAGV